MLTVIIAAVCLGLGVLHWRLSRMRVRWLGGIVPALWLVAVGAFVVAGRLDSPVDLVVVAVISIALARIWDDGRQSQRTGVRTS